ncbi:MAG TPA: EAL domain-containing protein [Actinotalea sp.]|nr:EAL domain-containing protein [Actinotalea sp.]
MGAARTGAEQQVVDLLRTARKRLGLAAAFLSRMDGTTQHIEVVDSAIPFLFRQGSHQAQATSLCQAIHDGRLPALIPDLRAYPEAMRLPAARFPRVRSYVSVPVRLANGSLYGTFCAAGLTGEPDLYARDLSLMEDLAAAAALVLEPWVGERARFEEIEARLVPILVDGGPRVVLQPIVDLPTGQRTGAEALSRFPAHWQLTPDVVFAQAHSVGLGHDLELLALERAARHLDRVTGYVAMNVSAATLLRPECGALLTRMPAGRVLLELSERDVVEDYDALAAALAAPRAAGMRLAIDDVRGGADSLRHIEATAPDVIKLDRSIVDGVAGDGDLVAMVGALLDAAHGGGTRVVAEGVETAADAALLRGLGVDLGQGWFYGRPGPAENLATVYHRRAAHALIEHAPAGAVPVADDRSRAQRPRAD